MLKYIYMAPGSESCNMLSIWSFAASYFSLNDFLTVPLYKYVAKYFANH